MDAQGRPHGPGTATKTSNGDRITGEFHHGEITGVFSEYASSGRKEFEGGFLKGDREGQGTSWWEYGDIWHGLWKDGRFKRGTRTYPDGTVKQYEFEYRK